MRGMAAPSRNRVELLEISPAGVLAGRTMAFLLLGSSVAAILASSGHLWERCGDVQGRCVEQAAGAGLMTLLALISAAIGVGIWFRVRQRPRDPEGSSRWVLALGVVFAAGLLLVALRIPTFTCARGRFDEALTLCMHPPSTSEPASWLLPKLLVVAAGLIGGVAIAMTPRLVRLWVVVALVAWSAGLGWSLVDMFGRPVVAALGAVAAR